MNRLDRISAAKGRRILRAKKFAAQKGKQDVRVCVSRSNRDVYAQAVRVADGTVVVGLSARTLSGSPANSGGGVAIAQKLGEELGKRLLAAGVQQVFFDRTRFLYHGRVAAVAVGLRATGVLR